MDLKISTDPKTVKMFRRLEKFLDSDVLKGKELLDFQNAETGRVFAVFLTPAALQKVSDYIDAQEAELNEALDTIEVLEDDNALLALIDAQNEVLMGRVDEARDTVDSGGVLISVQEYNELLNLREKRARDHKQLSAMDAKLKEKKKAIQTLESSRDHWKAEYYELEEKYLHTPGFSDIESPTLTDSDAKAWVRIAFTADAHRDGDYNGRFGWPICD